MSGDVDLLAVVRRRWLTIATGLVVGLGIAVALAFWRTPLANAEAELFVGPVDVPAEAVAGFAVATDELAATYAQLASSTDVISAAAGSAGIPADVLAAATAAEAVPESPLIRVTAQDGDPERARSMAGALASQLQQYVETSRSVEDDTKQMRRQLTRASRKLERAKLERDQTQEAFDSATASSESDETIAQLRTELIDAAGGIALLELEQQTLRDMIVEARVDARSRVTLRSVSNARVVGTDRASMAGNLVAAGGTIGLAVGLVLAISRDSRARRRARLRRRRVAQEAGGRNARDPRQMIVSSPRGTNGADSQRPYEFDRW